MKRRIEKLKHQIENSQGNAKAFALYNLGKLELEKYPEEAVSHLLESLALNDNEPVLKLLKSIILECKSLKAFSWIFSNKEKHQKIWNTFKEKFNEDSFFAKNVFNKILLDIRSCPELGFNFANMLAQLKKFSDAIHIFGKIEDIYQEAINYIYYYADLGISDAVDRIYKKYKSGDKDADNWLRLKANEKNPVAMSWLEEQQDPQMRYLYGVMLSKDEGKEAQALDIWISIADVVPEASDEIFTLADNQFHEAQDWVFNLAIENDDKAIEYVLKMAFKGDERAIECLHYSDHHKAREYLFKIDMQKAEKGDIEAQEKVIDKIKSYDLNLIMVLIDKINKNNIEGYIKNWIVKQADRKFITLYALILLKSREYGKAIPIWKRIENHPDYSLVRVHLENSIKETNDYLERYFMSQLKKVEEVSIHSKLLNIFPLVVLKSLTKFLIKLNNERLLDNRTLLRKCLDELIECQNSDIKLWASMKKDSLFRKKVNIMMHFVFIQIQKIKKIRSNE